LLQLDASVFWQVHRGTVVRATAIHSVNATGRQAQPAAARPAKRCR
jgi:hypothetical protein